MLNTFLPAHAPEVAQDRISKGVTAGINCRIMAVLECPSNG